MKKLLLILFITPFFAYGQNKYFNEKDIYQIKLMLSLSKSEAELSSIQSVQEANNSFVNEVDTTKKVDIFINNNKEYISNLFLSMSRTSRDKLDILTLHAFLIFSDIIQVKFLFLTLLSIFQFLTIE